MKQEEAFNSLRRQLKKVAPEFGDRLPSERVLSETIGCSRATVRAALARLEKQGEIWRHVGQGTFRGKRPRSLPIKETFLIEGASPKDLMQARILLEPSVAAAAAQTATSKDIEFLAEKVEAGRAGPDRIACEQADDAFHQAIATVSGNRILIGLLSYLSGARRRAAWQRQWDRAYSRLGVEEFRTDHSDQHWAVVEAISNGDASSAADAMHKHLLVIDDAMA